MQVATLPKEIERPSNFDKACRLLRDVLRMEPHANFLWTDGRWQPASLDEIMRRANARLARDGQTQFAGKREWLVQ